MIKKAILIIACVSFTTSVYSQKKAVTKPQTETSSKEKKPSKQETMDWIAGKMKENLGRGREFISYKDGIFIYRKASVYCETRYDLNKVTGMNNEYSEDFYISGKQITFIHCDDDKPGFGEYKDFLSISGPNYNDYGAPFNFTPDKALVERLKTAFKTLLEYNSTKKAAGEAF